MSATISELNEYKSSYGRRMTEEEMERCLNGINYFPSVSKTVREHNLREHKKKLRDLLEECVVSDDIIDDFIRDVINRYFYSLVSPGEPEGNLASGAVNAPATQMNLSAYHKLGIDQGDSLKSLQDIFYRKKDRDPENLVIHFKNYNMTEVETQKVVDEMAGITIRDLMIGDEERMNANDLSGVTWLDTWKKVTGMSLPGPVNIFYRLRFNTSKLYSYRVSLSEIKAYIDTLESVVCVPSPTILGYLDIFFNEENIVDTKKSIEYSNNLTNADIIHLYFKDQVEHLFDEVFDENRIEGLKLCRVREHSLLRVLNAREQRMPDNTWNIYCDATETRVAGIPDAKIRRFFAELGFVVNSGTYNAGDVRYNVSVTGDERPLAVMRKRVGDAIEAFNNFREKTYSERKYSTGLDFPEGELYRSANYVYVISATNILREVLGCDLVDQRMTILKNPYRVYLVFGIEAARNVIIREIYDIFTGSGNSLSSRHITVIADNLCYLGIVIAASSSGVNKLIRETLSEASSETPLNYFQKASISGAKENIYGTSSCVLIGTKCLLGTGATHTTDDPDIPVEYFNQSDNTEKGYIPNIALGNIGDHNIEVEEMVKPGDFDTMDFGGELGFRDGTDDDDIPVKGKRAPNIDIDPFQMGGEMDDFDELFGGGGDMEEIAEIYEEMFEI